MRYLEIMNQICEWHEIAANFDRAITKSGKSNAQIARESSCSEPLVGRARTGEQEPAISKFVKLCVAVDETPNDLVFREKLPNALPVLNLPDEQVQCLLRIARSFVKANHLFPDAPAMASIFARSAEAAIQEGEAYLVRKKAEDDSKKAGALPMGSTIQHTRGEKTIRPPRKSTPMLRKSPDVKADIAGEDPGEYQAKKAQ